MRSTVKFSATDLYSMTICLMGNLKFRFFEWREGPEAYVDSNRRRRTWTDSQNSCDGVVQLVEVEREPVVSATGARLSLKSQA